MSCVACTWCKRTPAQGIRPPGKVERFQQTLKNWRLHHIGIGRTHARTHVLLLVHDLDIRVVNAVTGELLRELVLDPSRDYQPTGAPKGPTKTTTAEPS